MSAGKVERRILGQTGRELSVLGFGGVIVANTSPTTAVRYVAEAFERGINYFDVAPFYGNAQDRLGPALAPYRDQCFLACKSRERTADGILKELENSLRLLKTDRFDLYQLHSLQSVEEDVEAAFAPGGAMETVEKAKRDGKILNVGFSAHTEEAAHAAMDRYDFDTLLFPFNYFTWQGGFGHSVYERAREKGMGVLALKSLAHRAWTKKEYKEPSRLWPKCWYKPLQQPDHIALALRFTLGLPVDAAIPPGHWDLFEQCLQIVESNSFGPVSDEELFPLATLGEGMRPLFEVAVS